MDVKNYISIKVIKISQFQEGLLFLGKIKFKDLLLIHKITERKENLSDPFTGKIYKMENIDEEFQRQLSSNKLLKIANFLKEEFSKEKGKRMGLFPNTIILALKHDIDYNFKILNKDLMSKLYAKDKNFSSCFVHEHKEGVYEEKAYDLYIPMTEEICLIVDGQHRFYGLKKFLEEFKEETDKKEIEDFEFPATFLIGFDVYNQGKIFAKVNFEQKPVNRSLYYDIFGSLPDTEKNDIKIAHDLTLHLNNNEKSPIKDMIKILGKGYGLFSQSLFVEKILNYFKKNGIWHDIYLNYLKDEKEYKKLPIFMKEYFLAIKETFHSSWPKKKNIEGVLVYSVSHYDSILCKSTGIGAMLELIRKIYPLVKDLSDLEMRKKLKSIFGRLEDKKAKKIFSPEEFGRGGGYGLQLRLRKRLEKELKL